MRLAGRTGDEEGISQVNRRWSQLLIVTCVATPLLLFVSMFLTGALTIERAWIGRRSGPRIEIPIEVARPLFVAVGLAFLLVLLRLIAAGVREAWKTQVKDARRRALEIGERSLWQGRPGLRTLVWPRALLLSLALGVPLLFANWIWSAVASDGHWSERLFWLFLPLLGLCFWVLPPIIAGSGTLRAWVRDLFGTVVITDRRIAWLSPLRQLVYREINGASLIAVALVDAKQGWVAVTTQRRQRVREIDLFGLRDPEQAVAAIETMMARLAVAGVAAGVS